MKPPYKSPYRKRLEADIITKQKAEDKAFENIRRSGEVSSGRSAYVHAEQETIKATERVSQLDNGIDAYKRREKHNRS